MKIFFGHFHAFALMIFMVLGQFYLLTHQIEHLLEGEGDHTCLVCELADHQANGLISLLPVATAPPGDRPEAIDSYSYSNSHTAHYLSRAPPVSI